MILNFSAAYVALSRATSLDGLQVLGFHPDKCVQFLLITRAALDMTFRIEAHPRVIQWMREVTGEKAQVPLLAELPKVASEGDTEDEHQYWAAFDD